MQFDNHVIHAYTEDHRRYHTIKHLEYMLEEDKFKAVAEDLLNWEHELLRVAIIYHDYIYDIPWDYNERLSAVTAYNFNKDLYGIKEVQTAIVSTENHTPLNKISKALIDLDLWALADPNKFKTDSLRIQEEYGVSDEQWRIGRSKWIEEFLKRDKIYHTRAGSLREKFAREILQNELVELRK